MRTEASVIPNLGGSRECSPEQFASCKRAGAIPRTRHGSASSRFDGTRLSCPRSLVMCPPLISIARYMSAPVHELPPVPRKIETSSGLPASSGAKFVSKPTEGPNRSVASTYTFARAGLPWHGVIIRRSSGARCARCCRGGLARHARQPALQGGHHGAGDLCAIWILR